MGGEATLLKEFVGFMPLFLLHISTGMTASFTTILIHYFEHTQPHLKEYSTLIGTSEDYAQIIIAVFGGFLQQLIGPRRMLVLATIPNIASWTIIFFASNQVAGLILSRLLAGASIGLMASNVYIADVASTKNVVFFNYTRQIFTTLGAILMYAVAQMIYKVLDIEFYFVSVFVVGFPLLAFGALLCMKESPVYLERRRRLLEEAGPKVNIAKLNLEKMKFPASSPTVYIPFLLISGLISLQHFSGFTYTKRFTIQVLGSMSTSQEPGSKEVNTTKGPLSPDLADEPVPLNTDNYYWAMLVCGVYLASSLLVARLLRSIRRRFMFFISLFLTSVCLIGIGFLMEEKMLSSILSDTTIHLLKVVFLCLHTFVVQCGLQGLPTQLADVLFPSSCKSIMKGITKAVTSFTLVIFIFSINNFELHQRFWIMAGTLLLTSPLLFVLVPEIRNIGKGMASNFILPFQTVFYIILPNQESVRKKWSKAVRKVSQMKAVIGMIDTKLANENALDKCVRYSRTFTFLGETTDIEEYKTDPKLKRRNEELVTYVCNILPQSGYISTNWKDDRVLVGRGPTKFPESLKESGGIFLFNDVLIVAKCLLRSWRYVDETSFVVKELEVTRLEENLIITSKEERVRVAFSDVSEAETWRRFIEFCQETEDVRRASPQLEGVNEETECLL